VAGGLGEEEVLSVLGAWAGEPVPSAVLILEISAEEAADRREQRGQADRIEARGLEYQRRVAAGYRRYRELVPSVFLVDASGSSEEVAARIMTQLKHGIL